MGGCFEFASNANKRRPKGPFPWQNGCLNCKISIGLSEKCARVLRAADIHMTVVKLDFRDPRNQVSVRHGYLLFCG